MFQNIGDPDDADKIQFPAPHSMPNPTSWNIRELDWNFNRFPPRPESSTTFTAASSSSAPVTSTKRKSLEPAPQPTKQFISERKMIEHLSGLHLSSDYTNHNISPSSFAQEEARNVFMSPKDLEEKLRNAERITVLQGVRKLNDDPILPKELIHHVASTDYCSALVVWQPPGEILKIPELIKKASDESENSDDTEKANNADTMDAEVMDNNNSSDVDFNQMDANTMDLDL